MNTSPKVKRNAIRLIAASCLLLAALLFAPVVQAAPLSGSEYDSSTGTEAHASTAPHLNWQDASEKGLVTESPSDGGGLDTCFGGGEKEEEPNKWGLETEKKRCAPEKSDVLVGFGQVEQTTATTFLHLAFERYGKSGESFLTFELNQSSATWTTEGGATIPCRTNGDLLLAIEANTKGAATASLYSWNGSGGGPVSCPNGAGGTFTASSELASSLFQGAMNSEDITNYINPSTWSSSFGAGQFGEAAINLPAVLGSLTSNYCAHFVQMSIHSRTSSSISSQLADYTPPVSVNVGSCTAQGKVYESSTGHPALAGWTVYVDVANSGHYEAGDPSATTNSNGEYTIYNVPAGSHVIREVPAGGWSCDEPSPCSYTHTFTAGGNSFDNSFGNVPTTPTVSGLASAPSHGAIKDTAKLAGGYNPTGTLTFRVYAPGDTLCSVPLATYKVTVSGNGNYESPAYSASEVGTYNWVASYGGDANNEAVKTACGAEQQQSTVSKAVPSLSAEASGAATVGNTIEDKATLTGAAPTGTLTFKLYGPGDTTCSSPLVTDEVSVSGDGTYSTPHPYTTESAGTYRWIASYGGDANNEAVSTACGAEHQQSTLGKAVPSLATEASGTTTVGNAIQDTARLSGGHSPTGTLAFKLYGPGDTTCSSALVTDEVSVSGDGTYSTPHPYTTEGAGTYRWVASYAGDANNASVADACGESSESTGVEAAPLEEPPAEEPPAEEPPAEEPPAEEPPSEEPPAEEPPAEEPPEASPKPTITPAGPSHSRHNHESFTFGELLKGGTLECRMDKGKWEVCKSLEEFGGLSEGEHTVEARQKNKHGVESEVASYAWLVEGSPPPKPTIIPAGTSPSSNSRESFTFGELVKGDTLECRLDEGEWKVCTSPQEFSGLSEGGHTVEARQKNKAGVESEVASYKWTVESSAPPKGAKSPESPPPHPTAPPAPVIVSGPEAETSQTGGHFEFSREPGNTIECSVDGGAYVVCTWGLEVTGLGEGWHSLTARQVSIAGLVSPTTTYRWHIGRKHAAPHGPTKLTARLATRATVADNRSVNVGCRLDGAWMRVCIVRAEHKVGGHWREVGLGRAVVRQSGNHAALVRVVLNALGRRLLVKSLGGLRVMLAIRGETFDGSWLSAAPLYARLYAQHVLVVPLVWPFKTGQSLLEGQARRIVEGAATEIRHARHVTCVGNTDTVGGSSYNGGLGRQRARTVCSALASLGVRASFSIETRGAGRPRASNETSAGRERNRRVELRVTY